MDPINANRSSSSYVMNAFTIAQFAGVALLGFGFINATIHNLSSIPAVMTATAFASLGAISCFLFYLNYVASKQEGETKVIILRDKDLPLKMEEKLSKELKTEAKPTFPLRLEMEMFKEPTVKSQSPQIACTLDVNELNTFFDTYEVSMQFYGSFIRNNSELLTQFHSFLQRNWKLYSLKDGKHTFDDKKLNYTGFKIEELCEVFNLSRDLMEYLLSSIPVDSLKEIKPSKKVTLKTEGKAPIKRKKRKERLKPDELLVMQKREEFKALLIKKGSVGKYIYTQKDIETWLKTISVSKSS